MKITFMRLMSGRWEECSPAYLHQREACERSGFIFREFDLDENEALKKENATLKKRVEAQSNFINRVVGLCERESSRRVSHLAGAISKAFQETFDESGDKDTKPQKEE